MVELLEQALRRLRAGAVRSPQGRAVTKWVGRTASRLRHAILVEPLRIEINHLRFPVAGLQESISGLRIAHLSDFHVSRKIPASYMARVVQRTNRLGPDVVVLTGDFIQHGYRYVRRMGRLLGQLRAPLGVYAVAGDMEHYSWDRIFEHTTAVRITESTTFDTGPLAVTGLSLLDSRSPAPPIPQRDRFHVVVGHAPDFALADPPADLLLAGHVHGGQVRLPGIGPLVTFSQVPRAWAVGLTELPAGNHLLVSRGIGTEEQDAPRLRFLCRPELVIIDVVPR